MVAPYTGAWIEITLYWYIRGRLPSLPTRERGLKYPPVLDYARELTVAPYTGAWIEIIIQALFVYHPIVAPYTGAWIEIANPGGVMARKSASLPTRERGLKFNEQHHECQLCKSLPTRERGLKCYHQLPLIHTRPSLPTRERGLKLCTILQNLHVGKSLPTRERGLKSRQSL